MTSARTKTFLATGCGWGGHVLDKQAICMRYQSKGYCLLTLYENSKMKFSLNNMQR